MENQPLVSIITTYYNSVQLGDFVNKSMNCLLNQTYPNIEFVCVNDGSQDDTLLQLQKYAEKDKRIILVNKENQRYAQFAKAAGQKFASGKYVMLFDHDDVFSLDATEKAVKSFKNHSDLDMVGMMVEAKTTSGKRKYLSNLNLNLNSVSDYQYHELTGMEALELTVGRYDFHFRGFYRNELFQKVSFDFTEPLLNADEIVERQLLVQAKKIGSCEALYEHFIYENSSAKSYSIKKIDFVRSEVILRDFFQNLDLYKSNSKQFELSAYRNLVTAIKIFHHFEKTFSDDEKKFQLNRIKKAFDKLDKNQVLENFSGISKLYHSILIRNYKFLFNFYKLKD